MAKKKAAPEEEAGPGLAKEEAITPKEVAAEVKGKPGIGDPVRVAGVTMKLIRFQDRNPGTAAVYDEATDTEVHLGVDAFQWNDRDQWWYVPGFQDDHAFRHLGRV